MKNFEQVCRLVRQGLDDGAYPSGLPFRGYPRERLCPADLRPRPGDYAVRHRQPVKDRGHHDDRIPLSGGRGGCAFTIQWNSFSPRPKTKKALLCSS